MMPTTRSSGMPIARRGGVSATRRGGVLTTRRGAMLLLPLLAAACAGGDAQPTLQPPPGYGHLTPLRLNVLDIEVIEPGAGLNFRTDQPAPLSPLGQAVRMGRERLVPVGTTGRARFLVDNATLTREVAQAGGLFTPQTERLTAVIQVRVEVLSNDGRRVGFAEAQARRTATVVDDGPASQQRNADQIVRQTMDDLNVEFEFQLRRNLRDWLMSETPAAPLPEPLQQENLGQPAS